MFYALERRLPVFPVKPGQKKPPLVQNGLLDATLDEAQIRKWWRKYPNANVAVRTGEGCWVLDQDAHAKEVWDALVYRYGLRDTLQATTPHDGRHYFWLPPEQAVIPTRAPARDDWGPGIDVRGHGGYVMVHPSVVDGKRYQWDGAKGENGDIVEADPWLVEAICAASGNGSNGRRAKAADVPPEIPYHTQHTHLVREAGKLRFMGWNTKRS